jgi:Zn-dependent peptidase ImmA (M78 family)
MQNDEDSVDYTPKPRTKWARAEAANVWKQHGGGVIPVMPDAIIESLGIPCQESDLKKADGVSHLGADGIIFIMYKRNCAPVRKRFTLAHELGHIVLDHIEDGESEEHSNPLQEAEANAFAGELLVPSKDLKSFMKQRDRTFAELMDRYQVSHDAIYYAVNANRLLMRIRT